MFHSLHTFYTSAGGVRRFGTLFCTFPPIAAAKWGGSGCITGSVTQRGSVVGRGGAEDGRRVMKEGIASGGRAGVCEYTEAPCGNG